VWEGQRQDSEGPSATFYLGLKGRKRRDPAGRCRGVGRKEECLSESEQRMKLVQKDPSCFSFLKGKKEKRELGPPTFTGEEKRGKERLVLGMAPRLEWGHTKRQMQKKKWSGTLVFPLYRGEGGGGERMGRGEKRREGRAERLRPEG